MGEINLIDDWVIVIDERNYALCKKIPVKQKDGKDPKRPYNYKAYGYYGSITNAMYALCDRLTRDELRANSPLNLRDAIKVITDSYDMISALLKECLNNEIHS